MLKKLIPALILTLITISSAHALVFIEPAVGYATGSAELKYTDSTDSTANASDKPDIKGLTYGLKGGLELGGLQLGAEYMASSLKKSGADKDFYAGEYKDSFRTTEMAALVGYRFWFARIYAGYIFSAKMNKKDIAGVDFKTGSGHKFGATFYALEHLAISLEHRVASFDKKHPSSTETQEFEYNTTALIVSFPFGI